MRSGGERGGAAGKDAGTRHAAGAGRGAGGSRGAANGPGAGSDHRAADGRDAGQAPQPRPEPAPRPEAGTSAARGITLGDAQRAVDAWISQFEEGYWPPLANLARLVEEVGELARELNHRYGHKPKKPGEPEQDLALELADILFVVITLANEQGIDLEEAFGRVLDKYRVRDAERWTRKGG